MKKWLKRGEWSFGVLLVLAIVWFFLPVQHRRTISPETTHVIEPLNDAGQVDFVEVVHRRMSQGVVPEKNACVTLSGEIDPDDIEGKQVGAFCRQLGVPSFDKEDGQFFSLGSYATVYSETIPAEYQRYAWEPWLAKDQPVLVKWLETNQKTLVRFERASLQPTYYYPVLKRNSCTLSKDDFISNFKQARSFRKISQAMLIRAMMQCGAGQYDRAWQDSLAALRFARLMTRGSVLEMIAGLGAQGEALRACASIITTAKPTNDQLSRWEKDLQQLPKSFTTLESLQQSERLTALDSLQQLIDSQIQFSSNEMYFIRQLDYGVDYDGGLIDVNKRFDRLEEIVASDDRRQRLNEVKQWQSDIRRDKDPLRISAIATAVFDKRHRGKLVVLDWFDGRALALSKMIASEAKIDLFFQTIDIAIALERRRLSTGSYPATLDELLPKYLSQVVRDPFTGEAIEYRLLDGGYELFSPGPNGKDDRDQAEMERSDDIDIRQSKIKR